MGFLGLLLSYRWRRYSYAKVLFKLESLINQRTEELVKEKEEIEIELETLEMNYTKLKVEALTMSHIIGEFDDRGKSVYSNAESRAAQQAFMLDKNEDYNILRSKINLNIKKSRELKAEIEFLKRKLEILSQ